MLDIARVLAETEQRAMVVPRPHPTLVTRRVLVMERLRGFVFDDVESMKAAGIDTNAVLRAGLIASLEGAMLYGVFHGDLHGGNLFVQPDGRTAYCSTSASPAGSTSPGGSRSSGCWSPAPAATCGASSRRYATSERSRPTPTSTPWSTTSGSTSR